MSDVVIRAEGLGKKYTIGHQVQQERYTALRDVLTHNVGTAWYKTRDLIRGKPVIPGDSTEEIWALRDVSFEVKRGEAIGIIGRNGAGKSTLLKVLSRITEPSAGRVVIYGRVASLLEVGTGFHPELTGRENIYLNGAILGMMRAEIKRKFDKIVAFAEVEKFLDTPVKRYSSGMHVRLAFAVAAHLEPEILVVDEVLAVGDAAFQKKCLGKMEDVANEGRTVLFVSHDMSAIAALTQRCLVISNGRCEFIGETALAIDAYFQQMTSRSSKYTATPSLSKPNITKVNVVTSNPGHVQSYGEAMAVHLELSVPFAINGARVSFQLVNRQQIPVAHLWLYDSEQPLCRLPGIYRLMCNIPKVRLNVGSYTLTVYFAERFGGKSFEALQGICSFEVVMSGWTREGGWSANSCTYLEEFDWKIEHACYES